MLTTMIFSCCYIPSWPTKGIQPSTLCNFARWQRLARLANRYSESFESDCLFGRRFCKELYRIAATQIMLSTLSLHCCDDYLRGQSAIEKELISNSAQRFPLRSNIFISRSLCYTTLSYHCLILARKQAHPTTCTTRWSSSLFCRVSTPAPRLQQEQSTPRLPSLSICPSAMPNCLTETSALILVVMMSTRVLLTGLT
ncbi:hypothetical protein IQ06DRAFT_46581 [Phaeosphaeriaceae sp. SRC1lsM3a]|nr:hypothetical protein IQ06DRAFT_46581 [Stagonospora sp. SRC1lsM3a]